MKKNFCKNILTVLAFLFVFALLINANVAKANATETGAIVTTEPVKNSKQGFIDSASKLPNETNWDDKYYSDGNFFKILQEADLYYRSLSASEVQEIYKSNSAAKNYEYVVVTKEFKDAIDLASEINELTGRLTHIAGALPINQVDDAYVNEVDSRYTNMSDQLKGYVDFTSDPSKIADAKAEVAKYKTLNEQAIAVI